MLTRDMTATTRIPYIAICATIAFCACETEQKPDSEASLPIEDQRSTEANAVPARPSEVASPETVERTTSAFGGEMQYMADAALFTECMSGDSYPMAMEADFVAAERAYRDAVDEPGGPLFVTFEGIIAPREAVDREGAEDTVIVERFIHAWPGERCGRAKVDASLVNTRWRIVQIGKTTVGTEKARREPHILLADDDGGLRYRATVGCNQIAGAAELDGHGITFKPGPTTLMACPPPLDAYERALITMLGKAKRWRVLANTLELFDELGHSIGLFQAVYL
jgi:copper homeostasis protein (lipoprotein)